MAYFNGVNTSNASQLVQLVAADGTTGGFLKDSQLSDTAYDATSWNGVTDVAPSKNAVRDKIEALAFSDLDGSISIAQMGSTTYGVATILCLSASVDFNSANTDTAFAITLPTGFTRYIVNSVRIFGASGTLTTSTFGVFTAAAAGGTVIVASGTTNIVNTASDGTASNAQAATIAATATSNVSFTLAGFPTLYFRVQTAQGSAATATVAISVTPLP